MYSTLNITLPQLTTLSAGIALSWNSSRICFVQSPKTLQNEMASQFPPTPSPTGSWTDYGGHSIFIEVIIFSIFGGIAALMLTHYVAM